MTSVNWDSLGSGNGLALILNINQCLLIVNGTFWDKPKWTLNGNTIISLKMCLETVFVKLNSSASMFTVIIGVGYGLLGTKAYNNSNYDDLLHFSPGRNERHLADESWSTLCLQMSCSFHDHYDDVIMSAIASQITSITIVYSTVYSGADQRKHESSASLAFVRGIHRGPVNSPHKCPVTRKMFPFDDVIMFMVLSDYVQTFIDHFVGHFAWRHVTSCKMADKLTKISHPHAFLNGKWPCRNQWVNLSQPVDAFSDTRAVVVF